MRIIVRDNERLGPWLAEHGGGHYRPGGQCIGLERDGEIIACVLVDNHNGASACMHVAATSPYWLNREYLRVCFDYVFRQLGCNVVIGLVSEANMKARQFDEHLGFRLHTAIPKADPEGALLVYTMEKEACRWLGTAVSEDRAGRAVSL